MDSREFIGSGDRRNGLDDTLTARYSWIQAVPPDGAGVIGHNSCSVFPRQPPAIRRVAVLLTRKHRPVVDPFAVHTVWRVEISPATSKNLRQYARPFSPTVPVFPTHDFDGVEESAGQAFQWSGFAAPHDSLDASAGEAVMTLPVIQPKEVLLAVAALAESRLLALIEILKGLGGIGFEIVELPTEVDLEK